MKLEFDVKVNIEKLFEYAMIVMVFLFVLWFTSTMIAMGIQSGFENALKNFNPFQQCEVK